MCILALSAMALPARAATLEVDISDPGCRDATGTPFCHIQAAVDAAAPGDKIKVDDGLYPEAVTVGVDNLRLKAYFAAVIDCPDIYLGSRYRDQHHGQWGDGRGL